MYDECYFYVTFSHIFHLISFNFDFKGYYLLHTFPSYYRITLYVCMYVDVRNCQIGFMCCYGTDHGEGITLVS